HDPPPTPLYTLSLHDALPISYRRTSAIIDHGDGRNYVVDFFDVEGGRTRDYIFHGPNNKFTAATSPADVQLYDFKNVRRRRGCRSEEHTSELQSRSDLVCRLL